MYVSKLQAGEVAYAIAPPPDLTESEQAEYRARIGAASAASSGAPVYVDITISVSSWSGGRATLTSAQYPSLANITANNLVQFYAADVSAQAVVLNNVRTVLQGTGSITFSCDSTPSASVSGTLIIYQ